MVFRSIEIYYDIDTIPEVSAGVATSDLPRWDEADRALEFRADAIELIEDALVGAHAGEWEGAGISRREVSFGFAVDDFDAAEAIVRNAVTGTRFEHFREIVRNEFDMVAVA